MTAEERAQVFAEGRRLGRLEALMDLADTMQAIVNGERQHLPVEDALWKLRLGLQHAVPDTVTIGQINLA